MSALGHVDVIAGRTALLDALRALRERPEPLVEPLVFLVTPWQADLLRDESGALPPGVRVQRAVVPFDPAGSRG